MTVQRMEMLNIIGHLRDMDFVSKELVLLGCMHPVNALHEIDSNNFTISTTIKDIDALVEINDIKPYRGNREHTRLAQKLESLMDLFELDRKDTDWNTYINDVNIVVQSDQVEHIYSQVEDCYSKIKDYQQRRSHLEELIQYFGYIDQLDVPWQDLRSMKHFDFRMGMISKENRAKLRNNYDNIPAIVYVVHSLRDKEVMVTIVPKSLTVELNRIYQSLGYQSLHLPDDLIGTPKEIAGDLRKEVSQIDKDVQVCQAHIQEVKDQNGNLLQQIYMLFQLYDKVQELNKEAACSDEYFYMAGWVPVQFKEILEDRLRPVLERTMLVYKDTDQVGKQLTPPTLLRNSPVIRPFEALVTMYGTPSYHELDPTIFVGFSYMLLFGAMFGDLGQGFLFLLAGLFLRIKKRRTNMGGILIRLGISSMIFGVFYGSVFGLEDMIPALLIRPMANINTMLIAAIAVGAFLLTIAFLYSLANGWKRKDVEEGLLGKNGAAGLLFFWTLLLSALFYLKDGKLPLPLPVVLIILGACLLLMMARQPIANRLTKKRPLYRESVRDYYIEEGFGILETVLSILSNTISFVRVGAFALNHVGLFLAFETMSHMISNAGGKVLILILGNVVVIGLEGLIVFIQGLRLEYYELFGKFYEGSGIPYHPVYWAEARKKKRKGPARAYLS